jgi:hypothetical protein
LPNPFLPADFAALAAFFFASAAIFLSSIALPAWSEVNVRLNMSPGPPLRYI